MFSFEQTYFACKKKQAACKQQPHSMAALVWAKNACNLIMLKENFVLKKKKNIDVIVAFISHLYEFLKIVFSILILL